MKHRPLTVTGMIKPRIQAGVMASCLFSFFVIPSVLAELPAISNQPWLGYYAVHSSKSYLFKITAVDGKVVLAPFAATGEPVSENMALLIDFAILETLPDGKTSLRQVQGGTLESSDPATDQLRKSIIRAKTAGEATIEITIEQARDTIFIGGRVLDPGTLTNPVRFSVTTGFPNSQPPREAAISGEDVSERDSKRAEKKQAKALEKRLKGDCVELKWTDGKKQKLTFDQAVDAGSKEINGPGIGTAEITIAAYGRKSFLFNASANSAMTLSNSKPASLSEGFSIQWSPDPAADRDGKARFAFKFK